MTRVVMVSAPQSASGSGAVVCLTHAPGGALALLYRTGAFRDASPLRLLEAA